MQPFTAHTATMAPLRRSNVDTDQIIPVRFLTRPTVEGYGENLFNDWRDDPDFVLNRPEHAGATVLVAGTDFGTGSSRESAVWSLTGWGFRAVVAPRFGDIFYGNALKNGLLPVRLDLGAVEVLWDLAERDPATRVTVDLQDRTVSAGGRSWTFPIGEDDRRRLLLGLDDVDLTLRHLAAIERFEATRREGLPTTTRGDLGGLLAR
ncbi:3-isopropylmalate dehydratase small subunit [Ornithinimicrobium tianjinense]|uniref:3-isopropylmalate dehydratase small subunit n=1 Tax=Ornithinimicrobium tianjinense TaxID=1195761 RepID=A0A917BG79_9MICO|nr:3-isopropylmalate dehydratase small subunit [Ornithinimicrobium tianjinense]GGF40941.1 3-isopropylmalate dehydratase small subunit [Ornithinimicrobium tianjinense]